MGRAALFAFVTMVVGALASSCATQPQTWDFVTTNDPVVAEDAFFAVTKRVHDQRDRVDPLLVERFKESARDVWRAMETWRTTGDATAYRQHWATMVERALVVEAAARRSDNAKGRD
jgi:hypothetical protein